MSSNTLKRALLGSFALLVFLLCSIFLWVYLKQEAIVQSQISTLNKSYNGQIAVGEVHLAPFTNFPYVSLKIDDVTVHESKDEDALAILDVADIYVGFDFWDIVTGSFDIQSVIIEDGFFDLVLHTDGETNLQKALATTSNKEQGESIDIHLQTISLKNLDIHKRQEATNHDVELFVNWANGGFNTLNEQIAAHIDSQFELNIIDDGDTTYFKHKHFEFHTDLTFDETSGLLSFKPSGISMEHGDFEIEGTIETKNEMTLDLSVRGTKPSFDMFIAFAPTELIPVLERYENAGNIYFNATLQGPTTNGRQPLINFNFGANEAYLANEIANKRIDEMGFSGNFTNGENRDFSTMEFTLKDITATLDKGKFIGDIVVKNFETPEIDMQVDADFDIDFIVDFLSLNEIQDVSGSVAMKLKFHDIIDLEFPERALNELDQAYFAELKIEDFKFNSEELPAPLRDFDAHLIMNGKKATLDQFNVVLGNSNISIQGLLSDLPAIIHHTKSPVNAQLEIKSDILDIAELTYFSATDSTGIDERIENLSLGFSFDALGNAFTEFKHLPKGEFFIDELYADLKHYPHTLHDFHADVLINDADLKVVDFTGIIDDSDFHFNGLIHDYGFWMEDELNGAVDLDITLKSTLLRLEDIFTYQGENYVPNDYKHEEIDNLEIHFDGRLIYETNVLKAIDLQLDKLTGKMHVHPLRFEDFSGRFHFEDDHLTIQKFHGKMGKTVFDVDMNYYLGEDEAIKKRDNTFSLQSDFIDFDALTNFTTSPREDTLSQNSNSKTSADVPSHTEAFNLYELPFTDMQLNVAVGHFIYHRLDLKNIKGQLRTTPDHFIYLDTFSLDAAGGNIAMTGYFNGSDPKHIYLKPDMRISQVDLDKILFKFENFGQDAVVSENLHGQLNATITGNIRVYPDMVPDLDQSEAHLDVEVLNGRLENYDPVLMLSDYFGDKDLTNIRFDTLKNHMDITNGKITIPNMTIESTLGHMEISGTQDMNDNIDYYFRIPWDVVKQAARNKLFGANNKERSEEDEILEVDPNKRVRYLNLNVTGTMDDFSIKMKKSKKQ
ncbi:MAG: AsmA-like C-terminal region-containing protein [Cyclobacteriaceae bacterium]